MQCKEGISSKKQADLPQPSSTEHPDEVRRSMLKGAGALGALYLAPTTLSLLLADRATAQSGCCGATGTATMAGAVADISYVNCNGQTIILSGVTSNDTLSNVDITQSITVTGTGAMQGLTNITFSGSSPNFTGTVSSCGSFAFTLAIN